LAGGCAGSSSDEPLRAALAGSPPVDAGAEPEKPRAAKAKQASAGEAAKQLTATATPGSTVYKIGPQDVLDISVFKVPDLSRSVQVADTGTINLALVGDVAAAGRTAQEIERDLVKRLGDKYLQSPQVTVFVREYNSQRITVEGAVKKPGVFPYRGSITLMQAIAMAQGFDEVSDTDILIFRTLNGKRAAARFDLAEIRAGRADDPPVEAGDVVMVPTNAFKEAFQNVLKAVPIARVFVGF